jgi:hypothetical protein
MEEKKLDSLQDMTEESFLNRPEQAPEAIDEYLKNITEEQVASLRTKLANPSYFDQFKTAITHTSLILFIAAFKHTQNTITIDFNKYVREFLMFAQKDDKDIYDMRNFYLSNLNAEEMGIGAGIDADEESETLDEDTKKAIETAKHNFNESIAALLEQYKKSKLYLVYEK